MKNRSLVIGLIAMVIAGLTALWLYPKSTQNDGPVAKPGPSTSNHAVRDSPTFGTMMSRVVVVEWFDPECEGCRAVHPGFEKIISDYSNRVHFVLRYMPFHKNSLYAAAVLEEARELGKFKEALDILFEKQPEWGSHGAPRPDLIPVYLEKLGIPKEKLERSYVIQKHGAKIKRDEDDGLKAGVTATPTFFINGQPLAELGDRQLRAAIDRALSLAK
jgi:protein-disulfide isomerase